MDIDQVGGQTVAPKLKRGLSLPSLSLCAASHPERRDPNSGSFSPHANSTPSAAAAGSGLRTKRRLARPSVPRGSEQSAGSYSFYLPPLSPASSCCGTLSDASTAVPVSDRDDPLPLVRPASRHRGSFVRFSMEAPREVPVTPYAYIYGMHPRLFHFTSSGEKVPARRRAALSPRRSEESRETSPEPSPDPSPVLLPRSVEAELPQSEATLSQDRLAPAWTATAALLADLVVERAIGQDVGSGPSPSGSLPRAQLPTATELVMPTLRWSRAADAGARLAKVDGRMVMVCSVGGDRRGTASQDRPATCPAGTSRPSVQASPSARRRSAAVAAAEMATAGAPRSAAAEAAAAAAAVAAASAITSRTADTPRSSASEAAATTAAAAAAAVASSCRAFRSKSAGTNIDAAASQTTPRSTAVAAAMAAAVAVPVTAANASVGVGGYGAAVAMRTGGAGGYFPTKPRSAAAEAAAAAAMAVSPSGTPRAGVGGSLRRSASCGALPAPRSQSAAAAAAYQLAACFASASVRTN